MNSLSNKHVAIIGLGSVGSAVADMLARAGIGELTLVDPDILDESNLKRHVLTVPGKSKVEAMTEHLSRFCEVVAIQEKFNALPTKPDVIAVCADSDRCCHQCNDYSLREGVPAVYGAVWGAAETAEIITVVPGETPCYACYEREGPEPDASQDKYTNPNYDPTKMPHQEGLWGDVLMAASLQFQAILGILGIRERLSPLVLMGLRSPFKTEFIKQKPGCAVCSDNMEGLTAAIV